MPKPSDLLPKEATDFDGNSNAIIRFCRETADQKMWVKREVGEIEKCISKNMAYPDSFNTRLVTLLSQAIYDLLEGK